MSHAARVLAALGPPADAYVSIDIETCGGNPHSFETLPTQVGYTAYRRGKVRFKGGVALDWSKFSPTTGRSVEDALDRCVRQMRAAGKPCPIDVDYVREHGQHPIDVLSAFGEFLGRRLDAGDSILGFNHNYFDLPVLARTAVCYKVWWPGIADDRILDAGMVELAGRLELAPRPPGLSRVEWYEGVRKHGRRTGWSLTTCVRDYNLEFDASMAHDAEADSFATHLLHQAHRSLT